MPVKFRSTAFQVIGLLGVVTIGFYAWFLYDDFQVTTETRIEQNQHVQQYIDDIDLYKKMLSIQEAVDTVCLSDGPQAKGLNPGDEGYEFAQENYEICFDHVFFKPSFQLPFYKDDPRENFNFKGRKKVFRKEMATYRRKFENIKLAQKLIHGSNEAAKSKDLPSSEQDPLWEPSNLSDRELYKMMRDMQTDMTESCDYQKKFIAPSRPREKMDLEEEINFDKFCYVTAVYYHSTLMPYEWWKGLHDLDVNVYFFRAKLAAYQARFPEISDE